MAAKFQKLVTQDRVINQLQQNVEQVLNPLLGQPLNSGNILTSISLNSGSNTIDHKLGRKLQGWFTVRVRSSATIFDTQDSNPTPQLNLLLTASANVVVDLFVF